VRLRSTPDQGRPIRSQSVWILPQARRHPGTVRRCAHRKQAVGKLHGPASRVWKRRPGSLGGSRSLQGIFESLIAQHITAVASTRSGCFRAAAQRLHSLRCCLNREPRNCCGTDTVELQGARLRPRIDQRWWAGQLARAHSVRPAAGNLREILVVACMGPGGAPGPGGGGQITVER